MNKADLTKIIKDNINEVFDILKELVYSSSMQTNEDILNISQIQGPHSSVTIERDKGLNPDDLRDFYLDFKGIYASSFPLKGQAILISGETILCTINLNAKELRFEIIQNYKSIHPSSIKSLTLFL